MATSQRRFSVHEVISILEDDGNFEAADIFLEPPPVDALTDEDSAEEDDGGTIENLNGRQLTAPAAVTVRRQGVRTHYAFQVENNEDADILMNIASNADDAEAETVSSSAGKPGEKRKATTSSSSNSTTKKAPRLTVKPARDWKRIDLTSRMKDRFQWNVQPADISDLPNNPVQLFELFFDNEVVEMIVQFSITYAQSKGNHTFSTSTQEVRTFLAILLVSGHNQVSRRRLYWSQDDDVRNVAISSVMTRDRFDEMMRYLHISDNAHLDIHDKMAKVRPLLVMMNERFLKYFIKMQNLSIDESMIPYYGRHGAKQFIRGKPIRFGFKMWVLTTPLGYVVQFDPYQCAKGRQAQVPGLGMGGSVVIDLISKLQEQDSYHLTFDNLFTSFPLVDYLTGKGITCTGTIRANRTEDCPLKVVKEMAKTKRGTFDFSTDMKKGLAVVRWNDNNVVNTVSNKVGLHPLQTAKRWSRAESRRVEIPQPFMIKHYNQTMGGVDRMDQSVEKYRTSIRSKKWWWAIFAYCLDLSVQQAWHLYRATANSKDQPLDLLGIRRVIARTYLAGAPKTKGAGRPAGRTPVLDKRVLPAVRFDGQGHLIQPWKTQLRCASCGMKTMRRCSKCQVGVHDRCFQDFHNQ